jgi:hypothetical protein
MLQELQVAKRPHRVQAFFGPGHSLQGDVFLHARASTFGAVETLLDLLLDTAPFFPMKIGEPPRVILVAKEHLRYLSVARTPGTIDDAPLDTWMEVEVQVDDTKSLRGMVHAAMPPDHQRTLDFVNDPARRFFVLTQPDRDVVVNRAHVQYVQEIVAGA